MENNNGWKKMTDEVFQSLPAGCILPRKRSIIFGRKMNVLPGIYLTKKEIKQAREGKQPYLFRLQRLTCSSCELIKCPHHVQFQNDLEKMCKEFNKKEGEKNGYV